MGRVEDFRREGGALMSSSGFHMGTHTHTHTYMHTHTHVSAYTHTPTAMENSRPFTLGNSKVHGGFMCNKGSLYMPMSSGPQRANRSQAAETNGEENLFFEKRVTDLAKSGQQPSIRSWWNGSISRTPAPHHRLLPAARLTQGRIFSREVSTCLPRFIRAVCHQNTQLLGRNDV